MTALINLLGLAALVAIALVATAFGRHGDIGDTFRGFLHADRVGRPSGIQEDDDAWEHIRASRADAADPIAPSGGR